MVKATAEQQDIYYAYEHINNAPIDDIVISKVFKLGDYTSHFQVRVERSLHRVEEMIADARAFLAEDRVAARRILSYFVPGGDPAKAAALGKRIEADLVRLEPALASLRANKNAFMGFAKMRDGVTDEVLGMSLRDSMRYDINPLFINKQLIYLDPDEVARRSIDTIAADTLHELTHARLGTLDSLREGSSESVYVRSKDDLSVDIASLIDAAQQEGNDPGVHASTLENLIVIFAYRYRGEQTVADIFNGRSTIYQRKPD